MPAIGISSSTSDASTSFPSSMSPDEEGTDLLPPNEDEMQPTTAPPILRHRHHRVRPPPSAAIVADLIHDHNDTLLLPPTNYRKPQLEDRVKNTFAGGIFGRTSQPAGQSLASVFLLIFVLIGIVMILMLFYFLAKVCNGPDDERKGKLKTKNGTIIIQHPERRHDKIEAIPSKIPYPKRIYELQAEEGYYSCPPSLQSQSLTDIFGDNDDDFFGSGSHTATSQRSRSVDDESSKKASDSAPSANQFVRKLTGAGLPLNFKSKSRLHQLQNS